MIIGAIDIGTNTILMSIGQKNKNASLEILQEECRVVRLGKGVDKHGVFCEESMHMARDCFQDYRKILNEYKASKVLAVATSGSRDSSNSATFFKELEHDFQIPIRIISGMEEASLSFDGAVWKKKDPSSYLVVDIGGGSTEVVRMDAEGNFLCHSFDMGCVRIFERFLHHDPVSIEELHMAKNYIKEMLMDKKEIFLDAQGKKILALAGTATYLASSILGLKAFEPEKIHTHKMSLEDILSMEQKLLSLTAAERLGMGGMDKGRADVIIGGAIILEECIKILGASEVEVSVQGLRHGLLLQQFS